MELRSCHPDERKNAITLSKTVFKDNMEEQFLCLFSERNIERMFIAVEDKRVYSMVNYYPATVLVHEGIVTTGSVGSVCTKADHRGQKLASRLLAMAEDKMKSEGISVMIISGEGGIYSAAGAEFAGNCHEWIVPQGNFPVSPEISLKKYLQADFPALKTVYETEPVRFRREDEEFRLLLKGQTYPDTFATYPIELIEQNGKVVAYAILHLETDEQNGLLGIKEFGGDRRAFIAAFDNLLAKYGKTKMHFATDRHDELEKYLEGCEMKPIHQFASFKIIDFVTLMDSLKPYWERLLPKTRDQIGYAVENGTYILSAGSEKLVIPDVVTLTRLVFGSDDPILLEDSACPNIARFVKAVFPIPFAWTHNINYQ